MITMVEDAAEPCSLETYAQIHAALTHRKSPDGTPINFMIVLAEHGLSGGQWLACDAYWTALVGTPVLLGYPNRKFDSARAKTFAALMQSEADRIHRV
jgi:hypothetical protein